MVFKIENPTTSFEVVQSKYYKFMSEYDELYKTYSSISLPDKNIDF